MKHSRFSEEEIIGILREHEAGSPTADVCTATFYKWKAKFGGLDVSDARRLKALEDENGKLKKLLAETKLDIAILKDIDSRITHAACREDEGRLPRTGARCATRP
jgi:putative transposase